MATLNYIGLFVALILTAQSCTAAEWKLWRRTTAVAACAAQYADAITTAHVTSAGAREGNPLLSNASGQPRWSAVIPIKAAICASAIWTAESRWFGNRQAIIQNLAIGAGVALVSVHNARVRPQWTERALR